MSTLQPCPQCGKLRTVNEPAPKLCKACAGLARSERVTVPCSHCGVATELMGKRLSKWKQRGRAYCSEVCSAAASAAMSSERMARTNRVHASRRMTERNPMARAEVRERVSQTLRSMGHRPPQAGNGRGPTEPQRLLSEALGWPMEVPVATGQPKGSGYPSVYKLDVGEPGLKIGVEVDGRSHCALARQAEDRKKQHFLSGVGWTVLRFSNEQVLTDLETCVQTVWSTTSKSMGSTPTPPTG